MNARPMHRLRAVGFWFPPTLAMMRAVHGAADPYVQFLAGAHEIDARSGRPFLPAPDRILASLGPTCYDERVARYLESGLVLRTYLGFSTCRCCGLTGVAMGSKDLTDGAWVWPEGLAHYLRVHSLSLPNEFLETMKQRDYCVPQLPINASVDLPPDEYDYAFWHEWSANVYDVRRQV